MAGDVTPQAEGARSLHLRQLRVQWQIVTLQVLATLALVWMYLEVVSTYVVGSIDHTQLFDTIEKGIDTELPLADWLTGSSNDGLARFYVPMGLGLGLAVMASWVSNPKVSAEGQTRIHHSTDFTTGWKVHSRICLATVR